MPQHEETKRVIDDVRFLIARRTQPFRVTDFATARSYEKATASRHLHVYEASGIVTQDKGTRVYRMSDTFRRLIVSAAMSMVGLEREA